MIYHITEKSIWILAKTAGQYVPESFHSEGFIHCCTEKLFSQVVNFYFKDKPALYILEIDEERLTAELKWEVASGQSFPHIYGPLNISAVVRDIEIRPNEQGVFEFPFGQYLH